MKKIFYCLFALFLGIISFFVISDNINVGAWTIDNEGNLVSDNIFDLKHYDDYLSFNNQTTVLDDDFIIFITNSVLTDQYIIFPYDNFMPNGVSAYYSQLWISFDIACLNTNNAYFDYTLDNGSTFTRFNMSERGTYYKFELMCYTSSNDLKLAFPNATSTFSIRNIMVTANPNVRFNYEPYGIWVSSSNIQDIVNYEKSILINDYSSYVRSLENQLNEKNTTITQLQSYVSSLENQVTNNFGWSSFFFGLLDIPLKAMTSVLNYDIMGVNLYNAFMGLLTALALIWVLKRFLK